MEKIKFVHILLEGIIILSALFGGWLLTETKYRLADKHPLLNRKPFSCRPCLTFHFAWMLSAIAAYSIGSLAFFVVGLALAFGVWAFLEIESRSKIDD